MQRIIGESSTLSETLDHVSRVAPLNRPILIIGERGSGKELIAERLHYLSERWDQAFDKLNCAAISETLLDSELFGHETGAFTGAQKRRLGRFERADGGSLFLDELGTMPMRIQEKLLRLVEYGEFERLGGQETLKVDVRIIAATNADLPQLARDKLFRADLLDRLAFDVIQVPPLRQRRDDIPALAEHFGAGMASELGHENYLGFSHKALEILKEQNWPGNIREFKNTIERSVCHWQELDRAIDDIRLDPFQTLSLAMNDFAHEEGDQTTPPPEPIQNQHSTEGFDFHQQIKSYELSLLKRGLEACQYHQRNSAEHLGISYHQLRALLKKYKTELE